MGSGSSRLGSSPRRPKVKRTKLRLASLLCGAGAGADASSVSHSFPRENCSVQSGGNSTDCHPQVVDKLPSLSNEPIFTSEGGTLLAGWSSSQYQPGGSSENTTTSSDHSSAEDDSHSESSGKRKCVSGADEIGLHHPIRDESKCNRQKQGDSVTVSSTEKMPPLSVSPNRHTISDNEGLVNNLLPQTTTEVIYPSRVQHEEPVPPSFSVENHEILGTNHSDSAPIPVLSDPDTASWSRGDDDIQEVVPSGLGHPALDRGQAPPEGSLIHVDLVSISSDVFPSTNSEITARQARRTNRRTFLDAFSSRSSRRRADFPAILFTAEDADLVGSRRRWLLDIGDDFFDDGVGVDSWHLSRRNRGTTEHRRNSRSEFWDRLRGAAYESSHHMSCPFRLHPDGSCSCELEDEASALSSISRIVLLAEALFEVLDEIHRQPESFSLSMLSVPAPESVVESLPLRTYANTGDCREDLDQCHICLVEYEEGDKIRVLPCRHEYHMSCVDKWLKEVHGVCPLCRGDVRGEGMIDGATPSSSSPGLT